MSRIQTIIEQVERGEPVDYAKALRLQALDVARMGETFVEETLAAEKQADDTILEQLTRD